jgi:hypothetical protein
MKKTLKVALHKTKRVSDTVVYLFGTPCEVLELMKVIKLHNTERNKQMRENALEAKRLGENNCCSYYVDVPRKQAEVFPKSDHYL